MNGELVGEWTTLRTGTPLFRYTTTWSQSPRARALSLSMPITADLEVRGTVVDNYFDNLLTENPAIRRRIRERFGNRPRLRWCRTVTAHPSGTRRLEPSRGHSAQ